MELNLHSDPYRRSDYKITLSGPGDHQLLFVKQKDFKGIQSRFIGKALKKFSTFDVSIKNLEIEWRVKISENNNISYNDLVQGIKSEFPILDMNPLSKYLIVDNFYEQGKSKTLYLTKNGDTLERFIELESPHDTIISIEEEYAYFFSNLKDKDYDSKDKLLFALGKDPINKKFTYNALSYIHNPILLYDKCRISIDLYQKYRQYVFIETYKTPNAPYQIEVYYEIKEMQKGEINFVLESIKGIPYSAEADEILNDKRKKINKKIDDILRSQDLTGMINHIAYSKITISPFLYLEFKTPSGIEKIWHIEKIEKSFKISDEKEKWIPVDLNNTSLYWKVLYKNQSGKQSIHIQDLNKSHSPQGSPSVHFLTDGLIVPEKGLFYDVDSRSNRYLAGIEKKRIDDKGKKLTDIKGLISRSKHTAVISLAGYSFNDKPISAWYDTVNEKYYATDLKKPYCLCSIGEQKLLVYDQENLSIYALNALDRCHILDNRFSRISREELILGKIHYPYIRQGQIIFEYSYTIITDTVHFIYDFSPKKNLDGKYKMTLLGIREDYFKNKKRLSSQDLFYIIYFRSNFNLDHIKIITPPYISLGKYGFYFTNEQKLALLGENSKHQNIIPLGIDKNNKLRPLC